MDSPDSSGPAQSRAALHGVLALLLCATLWSLNGPMIKLLNAPPSTEPSASQAAGEPPLPGITIACYRSLIGGMLFVPLALRRRGSLRSVRPGWAIGSVLTFTLMTACFVIATTKTAAASAIILQYLSPLVVFALSPLLLKETPRWSEGAVLLGAMAGVAVMFTWSDRGDMGPLLIATVSGLGYGALIVTLRGLKAVDPTVVTAMNFLGSGLLMLPLVPLLGGTFEATASQLGLIALMSVVQFALPYVIFSWAIQRVEAHKASLIVLLEPVLNPIFTWLAVGETIPRATLMGGPLILLSVLAWMLISWRNAYRERASTRNLPT